MPGILLYTLTTCPTCIRLKEAWAAEGIKYEERPVDKNQKWLNEALKLSDTVPIILRDGKVEIGFQGELG